jgi:hypothetical protein
MYVGNEDKSFLRKRNIKDVGALLMGWSPMDSSLSLPLSGGLF